MRTSIVAEPTALRRCGQLRAVLAVLLFLAASLLPRVADARDVVVGLLAEYPPYQQWPAGGAPAGYDVDLLRAIEARTGFRVRFERFESFADLRASLLAGRVDVATSMSWTPERGRDFAFTRSYVEQGQIFLARNSMHSLPDAPDLGGRRVAVAIDFVTADIVGQRWPLAVRVMRPSLAAAIEAVRSGDADLAFGGQPALMALSGGDARLRVARSYTLPEGRLRLAVRRDDTALLDALDRAIAQRNDAEIAAARRRWLAPLHPFGAPPVQRAPGPSAAASAPPVAALRIGYFANDPPYSRQRRDGSAEGIGIDLARAVARHAGLEIGLLQPTGLADGLAAVTEGRLDILLGASESTERVGRYLFVGPYRTAPLAIVSPQASTVWRLHQLEGRRLAAVRRFFAVPMIRQMYPGIEIVECAHFDQCLDLVEQGQADATIYGLPGLNERIGLRQESRLTVGGVADGFFDEDNFVLAVNRPELAARLRAGLDRAIVEDLPQLEARQAGAALDPGAGIQRLVRRLVAALAFAAAALLAWWWHSRRLRREVQHNADLRQRAEHYLAFMAHEVRNALQSVSGAAALLNGSPSTGTAMGPDEQQRLLLAVSQSSRSTVALLDALLDRHRLYVGELSVRLRAESIPAVVREVVRDVRLMAQSKGLDVHFEAAGAPEGDQRWMTDALRLQQVLRNLLVNAVKFSDRGEIGVAMAWQPSARGSDWRTVTIEVRDQGSGLTPQQRAELFKPFQSRGGDRPGTGLGLALSRDLIGALGGQLEADGTPGVGSTFTMRLDMQQAPTDEAAAASPGRVIVIEDSPVYRLLIKQAFARAGIDADCVETIADALVLLDRADLPFGLILSDINHEQTTIWDLLRELETRGMDPRGRKPGPAVMAMSSTVAAADERLLREWGVIDVLTKGADVAPFIAQVRESFAASRRA